MPFDWPEYLELAKDLAGLQSSGYSREAAERSAVSRAYYAAFGQARNYAMQNLNFQPGGTAADHGTLRNCLRRSKPQVAADLNRLRQWRNACDYDASVPNLSQLVRNSITLAGNIIQACP